MATINGNASDNSLTGTSSADSITGFDGDDTIYGGDGDDVINGGDPSASPTPLDLNWTSQGGNGTNLAGGFTQNTGGINVAIDFTDNGGGTTAQVATSASYVAGGETFNPNSGLSLRGDGSADTWTVGIDFSAVGGSGFADEVENVSFRLQDVDAGGWQDIVTVIAYDANGNQIAVVLSTTGDDTILGNTVTAGPSSTAATNPNGSVLVQVAGPVARIEIIYENGGTAGQLLFLSDVQFEAIPSDDDAVYGQAGNDTITGGFGDDLLDGGDNNDHLSGDNGTDTLVGGTGNDTLDGGAGNDSLRGDAGEDLFQFTDSFGTDTVAGGEAGDDLDTLDFSALSTGIDLVFDGDEQGDVSDTGSGDSVEFTEIEQVIATDQDDTVDAAASTADQTIIGGGGADSLTGGSGNDTIHGDSGDGVSDLGVLIHEDSFDTGADGWSPATTDDTDAYFGSVLGRIQGTASATDIELSRSFDLDPAYDDAVIEFDFHRIDSWDNEEFQIYANGQEIFSQAFYPNTAVGGSNTITIGGVTYTVTLTSQGDAAQNGYWNGQTWTTDQSFRVRIEIENAPDTLELGFGSTLNQAVTDESYALDNFVVVSTNDTTIDPTLLTSSGSAHNDTIAGGDGDDLIHGEEGADSLSGDAGNDTLFGGEGADVLSGGAGQDSLTGGQGADTMTGGADEDWFFGGSGDVIDGGEDGNDQDTLFLGDGGATITYDPGNPENGTVTFSDGTTLTFSNIETVIPCFTPGSRVATERGTFKVEDLRVGDLIATRDNGLQRIRWIGRKHLTQSDLGIAPHLRPIRIKKGALGPNVPNRDMDVSPQHRMLFEGARAELLFGHDEVLVRAKHLTHLPGIEMVRACERVTYIHLMCDAHEILKVDGAWTESFQPGDMVQNIEAREIFGDLLHEFPELLTERGRANYTAARLSLKAHEAALIGG